MALSWALPSPPKKFWPKSWIWNGRTLLTIMNHEDFHLMDWSRDSDAKVIRGYVEDSSFSLSGKTT